MVEIQRLKNRPQFLAVSRSPLRDASDVIVIQALRHPSSTLVQVRLGVIATKKQGNAVKRNRAKRRMKAAFRVAFSHMCPKESFDVVMVARDKTIDCPFAVLHKKVEKALMRFALVNISSSTGEVM